MGRRHQGAWDATGGSQYAHVLWCWHVVTEPSCRLRTPCRPMWFRFPAGGDTARGGVASMYVRMYSTFAFKCALLLDPSGIARAGYTEKCWRAWREGKNARRHWHVSSEAYACINVDQQSLQAAHTVIVRPGLRSQTLRARVNLARYEHKRLPPQRRRFESSTGIPR